jgi:hypothetical protein
MIPLRICVALCALSAVGFGQLTTEQKVADFQELVALYDKNYGPYEWKRDTIGFDLLDIGPWVDRVRGTTNDLDFYEVMIDYVAHLNDAHDTFTIPSNFSASLNISGDLYDGKVLIDGINRGLLPVKDFPFQIGDEVVSVDGQDVETLIRAFSKYSIYANTRSTRRGAVARIFSRPQTLMPHAVDLGDTATVVIRRDNGDLETYTIPWVKTGLPLTSLGPVPGFGGDTGLKSSSRKAARQDTRNYMAVLEQLWNCSISNPDAIIGWGARNPIFALPSGFTQRLGRVSTDFFYSGTFSAGGYRIGFIRIPSYSPPDANAAVNQFASEMLFFETNTDGLIIDDMRNPGGSVAFMNTLATLVSPTTFRSLAFEVRSTSNWVGQISSSLESAKAQAAPGYILRLLEALKSNIMQANNEFRGRTGPIPLDDVSIDRDPILLANGVPLAYSKPIMVLVDEFSASGGDAFPATLQDNGRSLTVGYRTMGAGGNVVGYNAGTYSEGSTTVTQSLMNRKNSVAVDGFPSSPYVENVGVQPDVVVDYMTKDNLLQAGKPFVDTVTALMVDYIKKSK